MLDLDSYLSRIAYTGPREPTLNVLKAVCSGHSSAIPYENIDPLLGISPNLDIAALQKKMITQRRGGYCFEQNALMRESLTALGMTVTSLAARVIWMAPPEAPIRARTHMLLKVEVSDVKEYSYIVDVGFGGQLFGVPLLLRPEIEQPTSIGLQRIVYKSDIYTVEVQSPHGWSPLYQFDLAAHFPVDYEPLNWFTATHPSSIFRRNLLIQNLNVQGRTGLFNDRLIWMSPGQSPQTRRIKDLSDFEKVLTGVFNLTPPIACGDLFDRIPKGLDSFVTSE